MAEFDYLIVGAGWLGAVFAREMTNAGYNCLVIDRRSHIGGNSFTESVEGIQIHRYGPHIFHTDNEAIWRYVSQFTEFVPFVYNGRVQSQGRQYSFPINLNTLKQVWGVTTPEQARRKLDEVRLRIDHPRNLEEWILSQIGEELYQKFIYGYTAKQWQRHPRDLPASIVKRLPIRIEANDNYYDDKFQGIPKRGYTAIFDELLNGVRVELGLDYFTCREDLERRAQRVLYTGRIDQLFGCCFGELEYRSLRFETKRLSIPDFQSTAIINYADIAVPFTRIVEHKHFTGIDTPSTIVTWEYPQAWHRDAEPFYPINDDRNQWLFDRYADAARSLPNLICDGRLARYRYYDMHQVIAAALMRVRRELDLVGPRRPRVTVRIHNQSKLRRTLNPNEAAD